MTIFVAGLGNVFRGDDGFGCEVAARLAGRGLPPAVRVVEFGMRAADLTKSLLDGCEAVFVADTARRGGRPGELYLIEPQPRPLNELPTPDELMLSVSDLDPDKLLTLVHAVGGRCCHHLVIACEPLTFGGREGAIGLSEPVVAAVDSAARMLEGFVLDLLDRDDDPDLPPLSRN